MGKKLFLPFFFPFFVVFRFSLLSFEARDWRPYSKNCTYQPSLTNTKPGEGEGRASGLLHSLLPREARGGRVAGGG